MSEFLARKSAISRRSLAKHTRQLRVGQGQGPVSGSICAPLLHDRALTALGRAHLQAEINQCAYDRDRCNGLTVVVALRGVPGSTKKSLAPVFRFTAQNGMSFTVNSSIYQRPSTWQLGGRVRVLYQEEHPENAHIDSFWQLWMPQFVLGIVGGGFSVIPLLVLLGRRRSAQ